MPDLEDLTDEECWTLLEGLAVGRVAIAVPGRAPLVVPVNYAVDRGAIVFRTRSGTKLDLLAHLPMSFQVDTIDYARRAGWSVLVEGVGYHSSHWATDHVELHPWPGEMPVWIRLEPARVSGRRLVPDELVVDARGYL